MDFRIKRQLSKLARVSKRRPTGRRARVIRRKLTRLGWTGEELPAPVVEEAAPKPKRKKRATKKTTDQ